ncbi:MAG: hypothetical protein ACREXY_23190, partial [Gammaproteobacteria bacterium]
MRSLERYPPSQTLAAASRGAFPVIEFSLGVSAEELGHYIPEYAAGWTIAHLNVEPRPTVDRFKLDHPGMLHRTSAIRPWARWIRSRAVASIASSRWLVALMSWSR